MRKTKMASLVPVRHEIFQELVLKGFTHTSKIYKVSRGTLDDLVQRYLAEYERVRTKHGRNTSRRAPRRGKPAKSGQKGSRHSRDGGEAESPQFDSKRPALARHSKAVEIQFSEDPQLSLKEKGSEELLQMIPERVHPAANMMPLWAVPQLRQGADQLQLLGQLPEPIEVLKGTGEIIDGRNRRIMCLLSGVPPRFTEIDLPVNLSVRDYVDLRNIRRRQLTKDQLATFAADKYLGLREKGKVFRTKNLRKGAAGNDETQKSALRGSNLEKLANIYAVNRRYIQCATKLKELNEVLFQRVRSGEITLIKALSQIRLKQNRNDPALKKTEKPSPRASLVLLIEGLMHVSRNVPLGLRSELAPLVKLARKALKGFNDAPTIKPIPRSVTVE